MHCTKSAQLAGEISTGVPMSRDLRQDGTSISEAGVPVEGQKNWLQRKSVFQQAQALIN